MIVTALPGRSSTAIRDALLSHGWEGVLAGETAGGLEPCAYHLAGLAPDQVEALLQVAPRYGLELLTGDDWAILTGGRSRFSAMARSWSLPEPLRPLAVPIGLGLPADPATAWIVAGGAIELGDSPVFIAPADAGSRFLECRLGDDDLAAVAARADAGGLGLLLTATDTARPATQGSRAVDELVALGIAPERAALDPGWVSGALDLGQLRALGRPLVCSGDDAVTAVLAWQRGARLFRAQAAILRDALARAAALGS